MVEKKHFQVQVYWTQKDFDSYQYVYDHILMNASILNMFWNQEMQLLNIWNYHHTVMSGLLLIYEFSECCRYGDLYINQWNCSICTLNNSLIAITIFYSICMDCFKIVLLPPHMTRIGFQNFPLVLGISRFLNSSNLILFPPSIYTSNRSYSIWFNVPILCRRAKLQLCTHFTEDCS